MKVGGMNKLLAQYKLTKEELSKVIFPLKEQIRNALVSVLVVVTIITLFLTLIDFVLSSFVASIL
ncbi:Preprotein translocase subunit SecE (TC 3.A.5.1.1) [Helicobacter ailurogastricus]|uniref:Protein translocase subunit SecE n=2 Tax=Helicobacter ailurogastricus TaxID=1578720 RepID=A0A0K2XZP1_9HELI|nr:Preprotein translocase subunit SecE (TC 3.A.5.1.1) [Helicobacter ailurogastricus]